MCACEHACVHVCVSVYRCHSLFIRMKYPLPRCLEVINYKRNSAWHYHDELTLSCHLWQFNRANEGWPHLLCHVTTDSSKAQMRDDPTYSVMSPLTVQKRKWGVAPLTLSCHHWQFKSANEGWPHLLCHVTPDSSKAQMRGDPTYSVMSPLTVQKRNWGVTPLTRSCHPDSSTAQMRGDPTYSIMSPLTVQKRKWGVTPLTLLCHPWQFKRANEGDSSYSVMSPLTVQKGKWGGTQLTVMSSLTVQKGKRVVTPPTLSCHPKTVQKG